LTGGEHFVAAGAEEAEAAIAVFRRRASRPMGLSFSRAHCRERIETPSDGYSNNEINGRRPPSEEDGSYSLIAFSANNGWKMAN